jgi:glutathione S-transferase
MKLFFAPGACSIGIHVLLHEVGKPFEHVLVNLREGEQYKPGFQAVNPKGKVPTLMRDDGSILTEYPAIAYWIASSHPEAKLMPEGAAAQAQALEATDYCVATMHMQGFSRIFRPVNFSPDEASHEAVKARGMEIFSKGFATMDKALAGRDWIAGSYSFADSALFYVSFWGAGRLGMELPANVKAHYERMLARPAVKITMQEEGLV